MTMPNLVAAYNGVYTATVVKPPDGKPPIWVVVPRLNGSTAIKVVLTLVPVVIGDQVLVATLSGLKDSLGILGIIL